MSDIYRTYYAMKGRRGGLKLTIREKLLSHRMHTCPGNLHHNVPRRKIIFNRRIDYGHACYVMYWRAHMQEYKQMLDNSRQNIKARV